MFYNSVMCPNDANGMANSVTLIRLLFKSSLIWVCTVCSNLSISIHRIFYGNHLLFQDGSLSATGDSVIVIGAASKGIIQRDQQHNVQVYKTQYAANPFENMSEEEIERYKYDVEHKGMEPVEEGKA